MTRYKKVGVYDNLFVTKNVFFANYFVKKQFCFSGHLALVTYSIEMRATIRICSYVSRFM